MKQAAPWSFKWGGFPDDCSAEEKNTIGFTNASVTAALLKHWDFPANIIEPIRWQYAPNFAGYHQKAACLLHVAKWLRDAAPITRDDLLPPPPADWILGSLGLLSEDLRPLRLDVNAAFAKTMSLHQDMLPARG